MARTLSSFLLLACLASVAAAQPPVGDLQFLPGDDVAGTPVERQQWPQIAPGGPGYLVVWQDMRTVLCGFTQMPENPFCGNGWDIYAARLDGDGALLDPTPILVSQEGRNQTRPKVAWNGTSWLVVWERERPEWYFFEDIVGARISVDGTVLDPEPIPLWLDCNSGCSAASSPMVASDGNDWLVAWESYDPSTFIPTLEGVRVAGTGEVRESTPVVLQQHTVAAFGPRQPRAVWANGEYLLAWNEAAPSEIRFKRFTAELTPLDASPIHVSNDTGDSGGVRLATDGDAFLLVTPSYKAYRINHAGQVLDSTGIGFAAGAGFQPSGPDVAWDGFEWIVAFSSNPSSPPGSNADVYMLRIDTQGSIAEGPTPTLVPVSDDYMPATASLGDGRTQLVWSPSDFTAGIRENVSGANVSDLSLPGPIVDTAVGLPRQTWPSAAGHDGEHLVAFLAQGAGQARILVQRVAADGTPLDAEPTQIAAFEEIVLALPDVAWDGQRYLVTWTTENGSVWGRRVSAGGVPIDLAPVSLVTDAATGVAVGGLAGQFLVVYTHVFSGDQQTVERFRVDGATLALLDTPTTLSFSYALAPTIAAFPDRWLVAWEQQASHDQSASSIRGALVDATGGATGSFVITTSGFGDDPAIAIAGDRALVVWHDNSVFQNARIEGRLMGSDGGFLSGEILIADRPGHEYYPGAAWSGSEFVVAWMDFNHLLAIEQPRSDIWAARLDFDGVPLDPDGFAITDSPGPDDAPVLVGGDDKVVVAFSALGGASGPEVQRIGYRVVGIAGVMLFEDGFESGNTSAWSLTQP
jgi:hypothetical protein